MIPVTLRMKVFGCFGLLGAMGLLLLAVDLLAVVSKAK